jgi:hypothetical protein
MQIGSNEGSAQRFGGQVAQSVEQRTENPCVGGSIPPLPTIILKFSRTFPIGNRALIVMRVREPSFEGWMLIPGGR